MNAASRSVTISGLEASYLPVFPVMIEFPLWRPLAEGTTPPNTVNFLRLASTVSNALFMDGTPAKWMALP